MASFARSSLLRQTLATTRSPLLRQNVGVSQAVAFHASAKKQILPPLPRKLGFLEGSKRHMAQCKTASCEFGDSSDRVNLLANALSVVQRVSKEPVRFAGPISNLDASLLAFQALNPLYTDFT